MNESHQGQYQTPEDHYPANGLSCANSLEQQIAGNLEYEIAYEENAGPKPINGITEAKIRLDLKLSKANVNTV